MDKDEKDENSSKQILLSMIAIAILVLLVIGVSFAFFSYTKTGSTTNTIATGEIYTYMNTGNTMRLENAMPVKTSPTSVVSTTTGDVGALTFTITGKNQSDTDITYKVYLVPGDSTAIPTGKTNMLDNSDIGVLMSGTATGGTKMTDILTAKTVDQLITANNGTTLADGALLGTGVIPKHTDSDITHNYTLNMWVRGETVKISDTDLLVNGVAPKYCAHETVGNPQVTSQQGNYGCELYMDGTTLKKMTKTDTKDGKNFLPVYSSAYYLAKIRVVANTNANNTGVNYNGN